MFKSYWQEKNLQKIGKTSRSRSQGQNCWYPQKDLFTRNTRMKFIKAQELTAEELFSDRIILQNPLLPGPNLRGST